GKTDDGVYPESCGGSCGDLHLLSGPLAKPLPITAHPHPAGYHVLVPVVNDCLAHRLAIEVIGDRPTSEPVLLQNVSTSLQVALVLDRFRNVEMITPAGNLQAVVAP